jgi:hypothetical protein
MPLAMVSVGHFLAQPQPAKPLPAQRGEVIEFLPGWCKAHLQQTPSPPRRHIPIRSGGG